MKKVLFVLMALCLVSSLAFAAEYGSTTATTDPTITAATATTTEETTTTTTTETMNEPVATPVATPVAATVATPVATPVAATVATPVAIPKTIALRGDVIDNMCAGVNKANLAEFVKTHTKECALKPGCMDSGYSIFAGGKLYAFDKVSSAKIAEFLKKADSKLQVTITAKQVGDELNLVSIQNQN